MKKLFTFGMFLFFIAGIGNYVNATRIKSAGTGITGLDWSNTAAWAGGTVPTSANTDTVEVVAGDSITVNIAIQSSPTLVVGGVLNTNGFALYVTGNAIVKNTGILSIVKQVYCKNIYNYGKTWAPGKTNSNTTTTVALYVGYNCSATTATASTDSCTVLNDGIIGWYRTAAAGGTAKGCGLFLYYPNIAKAVNITHTPGVNSGYVFTTVAVQPINAGTQSQDLNLYINESIAVVSATSSLPFSLHNNDGFPVTYKRTCTIATGDTVFVAGYFHRNSAPSVTQGPMIYNIYGCLDVASYRQSKNEFDILTSATFSSTVTINIGDGTQANAGTLVLGAVVTLNAGSAGQIVINPTKYSTLKFGYKTAPTITLTNTSLSAYNLYVNSFGIPATSGPIPVAGDLTLAGAVNNTITLNGTSAQTVNGGNQTITGGLAINNTSGNISLASSGLNVSGALTLTSGKVSLGSNNLTVGSISGGSATSYVVTDGAGVLTVPAAATATTAIPVGASTTSYDPVSVTPATTSNFSVRAYSTLTGTPVYGVRYNQKEWDITPVTASSTVIALTPSNLVESVSSPVIGHYVSGSYVNSTATMANGNTTFTGTFDTFSPFVTGANIDVTKVDNVNTGLLIYSVNNMLVVRNAKPGDLVTVYAANGAKVASSVVSANNTSMAVSKGLYIVKTGSTIQKVLVQ